MPDAPHPVFDPAPLIEAAKKATVHTLPQFSGDGYNYGGGTVLCIGGIAIPFGEKTGDLAKKIAEVWNSRSTDAAEIKALREALVRAREFIQAEHDCLLESITVGGDPSTMDDVDAPHFAESLQALEEIDRALLEPSR